MSEEPDDIQEEEIISDEFLEEEPETKRRQHISLAIDNTQNKGGYSPLSEIPAVMSYLNSIGAEIKGIFHARVMDYEGEGSKYRKEIATIKFDRLNGQVTVIPPWGSGRDQTMKEFMPTETMQAEIKTAWAKVKRMVEEPVNELYDLPEIAEMARKQGGLYVFRRPEDAKITMIEARFTTGEDDKRKVVVVYTHFAEYGWLMCEPENGLPIYNAHLLTHRLEKGKWVRGSATKRIMMHEGPKAAKKFTDEKQWEENGTEEEAALLSKHPFGKELREFIHMGWIGGANSAYRTNFRILKQYGAEIVYIVADNDGPGMKAVRRISYDLNMTAILVSFTDEFPEGFDLADELPRKMFVNGTYIGPRFQALCSPCTWATDVIKMAGKDGKTRETVLIRDHFADEWFFITGMERYVSRSMPSQFFKMEGLNSVIASVAHTNRISTILNSSKIHTVKSVTYRPDLAGRLIVTEGDGKSINSFIPTRLEAIPSTAEELEPWFTFMRGLIIDDWDRENTLRVIATLGGKLDVKMKFSMLLISDMTGTGKGTLQHICKLLVGHSNYSTPSEEDIIGSNNDWAVHKRLVIADEIYSYSGVATANKLKSMQTEEEFEVRIKYVVPYRVPNWLFIIASSNSMRAVKFDKEDRRWFTPMVTEQKRSREYWTHFYTWLGAGGAGRILWWCQNYERHFGGSYFTNAFEAPDSAKKAELIEEGMNEALRVAGHIGSAMATGEIIGEEEVFTGPMSIGNVALRHYVSRMVNGDKSLTRGSQFINSDHELRKPMKAAGMIYIDRVIQHKGAKQRFMVDKAGYAEMLKAERELGELAAVSVTNEMLRKWEGNGKKLCERLMELREINFGDERM